MACGECYAYVVYCYDGCRTLGGSYIVPVLQKNQYDAFSAPIVFQGSAVVVRFGIYIESMSNFQTSTMVCCLVMSILAHFVLRCDAFLDYRT